MQVQAEDIAFDVAHGGIGAGDGLGQAYEAGWQRLDLVAMTHPDVEFRGKPREKRRRLHHIDVGMAVFAGVAGLDGAIQRAGGELHAVADAEYRHAQREDGGVAERRAFFEDARRSAGEDDAGRFAAAQRFGGGVETQQFRVDVLFADASGNELTILRTEIEDGDPFVC